jgi:hypothetical protein
VPVPVPLPLKVVNITLSSTRLAARADYKLVFGLNSYRANTDSLLDNTTLTVGT